MIKYNLLCTKCKYEFDSWFSTSKEFERLKKKNLLTCNNCSSFKISKAIMSPNLSGTKKIDKKNIKEIKKIRKRILKYQKFIKENSIYAGDNFVQQARSAHYGKKKIKSIYGNATKEEIKELSEEGIETTTIPWLDTSEN